MDEYTCKNVIIDTKLNLTDTDIQSINMELTYEREEANVSNYLKKIKNKNGKYKRVCISPLRYAGGKSKAIGLILANMPKLREKKDSFTLLWRRFV